MFSTWSFKSPAKAPIALPSIQPAAAKPSLDLPADFQVRNLGEFDGSVVSPRTAKPSDNPDSGDPGKSVHNGEGSVEDNASQGSRQSSSLDYGESAGMAL